MFPKKGTQTASSNFLCKEILLKVFLVISFLPGELLFGKLWAAFMKAEGGYSVEVSSFAGSIVLSTFLFVRS